MKKTKKKLLQEKCREMLTLNYSEGGIVSSNEYNQFLCDTTPEIIQFMSLEGLEWLKKKMDYIYENTAEFDKKL